MDGLSVVKGSRNADAARAFVRYASRSSTRAPLPANDPTRVSAPESIDPIRSDHDSHAACYTLVSEQGDGPLMAVAGCTRDSLRRRFTEWVLQ